MIRWRINDKLPKNIYLNRLLNYYNLDNKIGRQKNEWKARVPENRIPFKSK